MSKFLGRLKDENFNFIAVDNFTLDVVKKASVFFLSHYHSDHFSGLKWNDGHIKEQVINIFKSNPEKKLYCSDITRRLFIGDDPNRIPENQIIGVQFGKCVVVTSPQEDGGYPMVVNVTLIPSGHILGAAMFLFEHENDRILFTGDFRICPDDIPKLNGLHYQNRDVKSITHLYLDTTFGFSRFPKFPLRSEVSSETVKLISEWFKDNHIVHIDLPYKFAYERLLVDLSRSLNCKIVIDSNDYNSFYIYIPELGEIFCPDDAQDLDKNNYKIHAFSRNKLGSNCMYCFRHKKFKIIRPCALSTGKEAAEGKIIFKDYFNGYEIYKVIYSAHCSFEELKAFVLYLNPKKITTIVNHKNHSDFIRIKEEIFSLVDTYKDSCSSNESIAGYQTQQMADLFKYESSDESGEEYNGLPIDSPPR